MKVNEFIVSKLKEGIARNTHEFAGMYYEELKKTCNTAMTLESFKRAIRKVLQKQKKDDYVQSKKKLKDGEGLVLDQKIETFNGMSVALRSTKLHTLEEVAKFCKIDTEEWEAVKVTTNTWGNENYPCWQYKVEWKRKAPVVFDVNKVSEDIIKLIEDHAPTYKTINTNRLDTQSIMSVISLYDHHFNMKAVGSQTYGEDYNRKISAELMHSSIDYLLSRSDKKSIGRFVIPIGNDFFNVNSPSNTTVKGTPQEEDGEFWEAFEAAEKNWVSVIERLTQVADVVVPIVPGNHDEIRVFNLGRVLKAWFRNNNNVEIQADRQNRKYVEWGKGMICFTHGEKEVKSSIPLFMATEQTEMFSRTKYREINQGHYHHTQRIDFKVEDENQSIRVRTLPSLVPRCYWTSSKAYLSLRESVLSEWDLEKGRISDYYYHP